MKRPRTVPKLLNRRKIISLSAALLFAVLGVYLLWSTFANTASISLEAERGILSGGAVIKSDPGSSGGSAVSFAAPSLPPPTKGMPTRQLIIDKAGVSNPSLLKPSGSITVRTNGAVIENLDISGSVTVQANDVTIRNVRIRTNSTAYGINIAQNSLATLVEYVDVAMGVDGTTSSQAAIGGLGDHNGVRGKAHGNNVKVRYSVITGIGDGIKVANNSLYEYNVIKMRRAGDSVKHIDGIQASGRSRFTIRNNWIDQAYSAGNNAAIFFQAFTGTSNVAIEDILVYQNYVNGGVYTIQNGLGKDGKPGVASVRGAIVRDNVFYRDYLYGVFAPKGDVTAGGGVFGGVWADNGQQVPKGGIK